MKKLFIPILILMLIPVILSAQSPEVIKAGNILDKVSEIIQSYQSIRADFTFSMENTQADVTDTHEGTILIAGEKYKASVMNVDSYFDGTTLWTHLKEVDEVNISNPDPMDETTLSPSSIFNIHKQGFRYIFSGEDILDGEEVNIVDMFPEDRDKPYSRIKVYVNKANNHITKISQIGKDGTNYIIDITNMETDVPVESGMFTFDPDKHPEVDIIDMR
ncbi:LolA family protein [Anaerophaga thermohalophila]|uniref:LolA family protein n=1 Tax=Anaerophaga thermohalophila TaxID=177400 RepID=UPI0002D95837|nr:outer membrane lipoprotein carrier protein LolA [Anaerophaga thermohalophila]